MSGAWLSGRALDAVLFQPWPTPELGAEERRTRYGGVPTELPPASPSPVCDAVSARILEALAVRPMAVAELVGTMGTKATVYRAVMILARRGRIERVGGQVREDGRGKGGRWALAARQEGR